MTDRVLPLSPSFSFLVRFFIQRKNLPSVHSSFVVWLDMLYRVSFCRTFLSLRVVRGRPRRTAMKRQTRRHARGREKDRLETRRRKEESQRDEEKRREEIRQQLLLLPLALSLRPLLLLNRRRLHLLLPLQLSQTKREGSAVLIQPLLLPLLQRLLLLQLMMIKLALLQPQLPLLHPPPSPRLLRLLLLSLLLSTSSRPLSLLFRFKRER